MNTEKNTEKPLPDDLSFRDWVHMQCSRLEEYAVGGLWQTMLKKANMTDLLLAVAETSEGWKGRDFDTSARFIAGMTHEMGRRFDLLSEKVRQLDIRTRGMVRIG